jgi:DnaJ-class molecular chaperone
MASEEQTAGDGDGAPRTCTPCRGAGRVISYLGGSPSEVTCPWCEGTGRFLPDHDAQSRFRDAQR